jgi:hypothetical protein
MFCFERAILPREMAVANAYHLREQARTARSKLQQDRSSAFIQAAEAFSKCARAARKQKPTFFRNAGDCYEQGAKYIEAAQSYLEAEEFTRAASLYRKTGMLDEAVKVVKLHKHQVDQLVAAEIIHVARLYYFQEEKKLEFVSLLSAIYAFPHASLITGKLWLCSHLRRQPWSSQKNMTLTSLKQLCLRLLEESQMQPNYTLQKAAR